MRKNDGFGRERTPKGKNFPAGTVVTLRKRGPVPTTRTLLWLITEDAVFGDNLQGEVFKTMFKPSEFCDVLHMEWTGPHPFK